MPYAVKEVQPTPNPNAVKLILDRSVSEQSMSFFTPASAENHSLATQLFGIAGVTSLLLLDDFITINKKPDAKWNAIVARAKEILQNVQDPGTIKIAGSQS